MSFKLGVGKKTVVSKPAAGTLQKISTAASSVGIVASKQLRVENDSIDRVDSAPPAEIVAIADFNRVYESGGRRGISSKTRYGRYYDALKTVHSITSEDVAYIVSKAFENDTTGAWSSLRTAVENDVENARDLVNDLARFLNGIERTERSLDIGRSSDEEISTIARDFLAQRVRSYEKQPELRNFDAKSILGTKTVRSAASFAGIAGSARSLGLEYQNDTNSEILKKMLGVLRDAVTYDSETSYKTFLDNVSQKRENDLNLSSGVTVFDHIDGLPSGVTSRLISCAEIISHVMSVSVGIPRVQEDPVSEKIRFRPSRIGAIFNGTERSAIPNVSLGPSPLPFKKSLSKVGPPSSTIALALLQFDGSDGKPVVPVEVDAAADGKSYRSGPFALIRKPILDGEFTFSDLVSFADKFEENRGYLDSYISLMKGFDDPSNQITPVEILRIIIRNFADGLDESTKNTDSMLQLLALKFCSSTSNSMGRGRSATGGSRAQNSRQHILRAVASAKYYKLSTSSLDAISYKEAGVSEVMSVTKTSEDSESILSDAKVSASLVQTAGSTSRNSSIGSRIIARLASDSPSSEDVAQSIYEIIKAGSSRSTSSRQEINNKITEKKRDLSRAKEKKTELEVSLGLLIGATAIAAFLTGGWLAVAAVAGVSKATIELAKDAERAAKKVLAIEEEIDELQSLLNRAPTFLPYAAAYVSLASAQKETSKFVFSKIVKAYDEIIDAAITRLPADAEITNQNGTTRFANLDEFGILSLVVECFCQLSSLAQISSEVDSDGNFNQNKPSKGAVKSLLVDILTLVDENGETQLGSMNCDVGEPARVAATELLKKQQQVQDTSAYLAAFSKILGESADELVSSTEDLLNDPTRRQTIDTSAGRQMIESLTSQQIIYRRSLIERYQAKADAGYLPARVAYSLQEDLALDYLLASPDFSSRTSENKRIVVTAIPTGLINNEKRYVEKSFGEINRSGMLEVIVNRKDHELDDLIFKEKVFLFDPQLFVTPDSFGDFNAQRVTVDSDAALSIAKRVKFLLCDRDGTSLLSYADVRSNPRYSALSSSQVNEVLRNTVLSYLLETYTFKLCGSLFDEVISLPIDDSTSQEGLAALSSLANAGLPDVILPTAGQISSLLGSDGEVNMAANVNGLTTGDKELIAALTSSFLMRNDNLTDRVLLRSKFDRVLTVIVDPDDFEVDVSASIKQNGRAARSMIQSLRKQGLLISNGSSTRVTPRDPLSGGFSIGSIYCQFIPHTISSEPGTLLRVSKQSLLDRLTSTPSTGLTDKTSTLNGLGTKSLGSITNASVGSKNLGKR